MFIILKANSVLWPYWAYTIHSGSSDTEFPVVVKALTSVYLSLYIITARFLHELNFLCPRASFRFDEPLYFWQYVNVLLNSKNNIGNGCISYVLLRPLWVGTEVVQQIYCYCCQWCENGCLTDFTFIPLLQ